MALARAGAEGEGLWCFEGLVICWQICQHQEMRRLSWVKAAFKEFQSFPQAVQEQMKFALQIACEGQKADIAKPMTGLGAGVFEIALPFRGDAYRVLYAVKLGDDLRFIHAFQKKSTQGHKTPQHVIDVVRERLKRLKDQV